MTSIASPRHLRLAGFAVGAVALAGGAVYVTASAAGYNLGFNGSSPSSAQAALAAVPNKPGASAACNDFMSHFASDLGTSQAKVNDAFQQAVGQTLADEVSTKDITQVQAAAIQKRLAGKAPCAFANGAGTNAGAGAGQYTQALMTAAASAVGLTPQQLKTDLASGMTLSHIAAAQTPPVTEDEFRAKLIANLKPLLDKAVTGKKLTSAQEQAILQRLQTGPLPFWNAPMRATAAGIT
jgi:hypothetical protein